MMLYSTSISSIIVHHRSLAHLTRFKSFRLLCISPQILSFPTTISRIQKAELLGPVRVSSLTVLSGTISFWRYMEAETLTADVLDLSRGTAAKPIVPRSFKASHINALVISYDLSHNIHSADPTNEK